MHAYPLYRPNRSIAAVIIAAAAIIGALLTPITLAPTTGATAPGTSVVIANPARQADPAARAIAAEQHITLAQAETRLSWQEAIPSLNTALSSQLPAASFGGIWIAQNDGDRIKVGVVSSHPHVRAAVMRAVRVAGLSTATDLVPVKYSAGQIVDADAWLNSQLIKLPAAGLGSIHLDGSYNMDLNRVELGVAGYHLTAAERALVARAKARYGNLVQVVTQPAGSATGTSLDCTTLYDLCYPPLRGGIQIYTVNSQGQPQPGVCTGGFIASSRIDGKLYEFTAGHCAAAAGTATWATEFPDGSQHLIGTVHHYIFSTNGDEAILNINNPTGWQLPQGWVYVQGGPNTTLNEEYPISSAQYSTQGARVCETGASSGSICGTVAALGRTIYECDSAGLCSWVDNLGEATFCGQEGDSGAPVYASHQAFGLVSAAGYDVSHGGCVTYYQGIVGASNAMNVNIVLAH